jgi:transposase-like protein
LVSFKRRRFPPEVIRYAVWLYCRFTLSLRDVEERLAQRGIEVSYETIRCWTIKFGPVIAANLRRRRAAPTGRWHLDERVVKFGGRTMWLWRAVDEEGEVLDRLVQKRRDTAAAYKLLRRLLKNQGIRPETVTTDGPAACGRTTGRKTATCRCQGGNASNRRPSLRAGPIVSSRPTPPSTTPSTCSPI